MLSAYNEGLLTPRRYYEILIHEVRVFHGQDVCGAGGGEGGRKGKGRVGGGGVSAMGY